MFMGTPQKSREYAEMAEECLSNVWNKDKAYTYAILALVHKLDEIHKTVQKGS